jgi:Fe-S cluster assembly iron-binding protein IscA
MITTKRAAQKLKDNLVKEFLAEGVGFRLISNGLDPSHKELNMKLDRARPTDTVVQSHGIKIFLDPISAANFERSELDYKDVNGGFFLNLRG